MEYLSNTIFAILSRYLLPFYSIVLITNVNNARLLITLLLNILQKVSEFIRHALVLDGPLPLHLFP